MIDVLPIFVLIVAVLGVWLGSVIGWHQGFRAGCKQTREALFPERRP